MPRGYEYDDDDENRRRLGQSTTVNQQGLGGNVSGTVNVNAPAQPDDEPAGQPPPMQNDRGGTTVLDGEEGSGGGGSLYGATDEDVGFTQQEMAPVPEDLDDVAARWNRGYLENGPADTTDEEAFINERIRDELGQNLVGQRARMGRAGFGSSGALAALESDAMRQANLDAQGQIYDTREREQNQAFDQGIGVQQIDIAQQDAAARLAQAQAEAAAIQALLDAPQPGEIPDVHDDEDRQDYTQGRSTWDYSQIDENGVPGSENEPYLGTQAEKDDMEEAGYVFEGPIEDSGPWNEGSLYRDQDGNYWYFDDDPGQG